MVRSGMNTVPLVSGEAEKSVRANVSDVGMQAAGPLSEASRAE